MKKLAILFALVSTCAVSQTVLPMKDGQFFMPDEWLMSTGQPYHYKIPASNNGVVILNREPSNSEKSVIERANSYLDKSGSKVILLGDGKKVVHVVAVEKSDEALVWLQKNITKHDVNVRVVQGDVSSALEGVKCDVVVANPPYLPDGAQIPQELNFEPAEALFGGPATGMSAPRVFIEAAARLLKPGGLFAIEHNELQGPLISAELSENFESIALHKDLTDRPRFTTARRKI
jgi:16S rRNA G966 N2-methylase RsmD